MASEQVGHTPGEVERTKKKRKTTPGELETGDTDSLVVQSGGTRLILVRHGETVWNSQRRIQGQIDISLNDKGHAQAKQIASSLQRSGVAEQVDAIVSSDLARASETADAIAAVCPRAARAKDKGLREMHFGDFQGQITDENKGEREQVFSDWERGDFRTRFPGDGGENVFAVMTRALESLRRAATMGSTIIVVCHGGLLRWLAISLVVTSGGSSPLPEIAPEGAMGAQEIQALLKMPVRNCCCSTVWLRETGRLEAERWFEDLSAEALDDTG